MKQYKYKRICIPAGPTVVWKKDKYGKVKPTIVKRKGYCKKVRVKR